MPLGGWVVWELGIDEGTGPSLCLRLDDELDAPIGGQPLNRRGLNVRGTERRVSREVLSEVVRPAAREHIGVQLIGLAAEAADTLHASIERRLRLVDRALHLSRLRSFASQSIELFVDHLLQLRG